MFLTSLWHPRWFGFFFFFPVVFLPPPPYLLFLSRELLPLPCDLAVPFLPLHQSSRPEMPSRCPILQHCSGHTNKLLFWWLPTPCLLSASLALPLWLFTGPSSSSANRCHFCLLRCWTGSWLCEKLSRACAQQRTGYLGDERWEVQNANFCLKKLLLLSLSASNGKTTLFLAELSLSSFSVSL